MLTNDFRDLAALRPLAGKCPRCSLCKFPPLVTVEAKAHSAACPSYEEYKVHAASGGGLMVVAMSLFDGRSQATDAVRRLAFGCTACGACDVACKYNSDIEVLEAIYLLRARVLRDRGPLPAHARILESIARDDHPLPELAAAPRSDLDLPRAADPRAPLLWIGPHYARDPRHRATLEQAVALLHAGGVRFGTLGGDEPYTGRAAWEIGDRALFARCAQRTAAAIRQAPGAEVICLSAEDFATLRALTPRIAPVAKPVRHLVDLYADLLARGRLAPHRRLAGRAAWHDASYLGRLSEPWVPWQGDRKKVFGQMIVMDPPRPLRGGAGGCYEPPRRVLRALPGLDLVELPRRREYAFDSGECGQAHATHPELARHTAERRLAEAAGRAELVVTECPQSLTALRAAAGAGGPRVAALTDLLAESAL